MLSKEKAKPSESDRTESSVLFSLKELRRLEDERVKAEADARRVKAEAERRAKAEAEQRARDEATRRAHEEEERRMRAETERDARQREDRLRLEEAERRARVEGELKLREQQLHEKQRHPHLQGRGLRTSAWIAAAAGATLFLAVGGGLGAWTARQHQAEKKALEQEIARRNEQSRAAQLAFDARIRALEEKLHRYPGEAKGTTDQARIVGNLPGQKPGIEIGRPRPPRRTAPPAQPIVTPPTPAFRTPQKRQVPDEPLGGLPDVKNGGF